MRPRLFLAIFALSFLSITPMLANADPTTPFCDAIGSRSEGWRLSDGTLIFANCSGCKAECRSIGTRSEGWYNTCDGSLIRYETCNSPDGFPDVRSDNPFYDAIQYVRQQGIVAGYPDGTFKPDVMINRAEFTKIVTIALFGQAMIDQCGTFYAFSDVPRDAWYVHYICRARDGWLLTGYPDNTFRPDRNINFAEAAKILANGYNLIPRLEHCNGKLCPDVDTVEHPWYEQYVSALASRNAIPVSIRNFDQPVTRGEMAEMIWRLKAGVTDLPSKTYEDLQGTTSQSVLGQIEQWTPGIRWSAVQSEIYPDSIGVDGTLTIPARSVESQVITVPQWNIARKLDPNLIQNGWTEDQYLAADGVTGSQWGYQKREGDTLRFLIFKEDSSQCTVNVNAPGATCAYHETNVFYTAPVRVQLTSSSQASFRTYSNQTDKFSISLPENWEIHLQNKPELLPQTFSTITGTKFQDPNAQAFVFVAITPACPDISINPAATTTTIDGKIFTSVYMSDGAAGSVGEETFYTSDIDVTHCIFIASFYFHSTGEALDEPQRSITKAGIAQEKALIEQVIHSLKFQ